MKKNWLRTAASMLALVAFVQSQAAAAQCGGKPGVGALHREWILQGWEKRPGNPDFDFRARLGKYYDFQARDGVFYDDFDPPQRVARHADAYAGIRAALQERLAQLEQQRDLAMSTDVQH